VGNKAAAGNPFHRAVAARRKALLDAISPDDVAAVARQLQKQALAGDVAAAKVLLVYVVGKPAEAADPDRLDLDEVRMLLAGPWKIELLARALEGTAPAEALAFLQQTAGTTFQTIVDAGKDMSGARRLHDFLAQICAARAKGQG
jgi:hypothetical protein